MGEMIESWITEAPKATPTPTPDEMLEQNYTDQAWGREFNLAHDTLAEPNVSLSLACVYGFPLARRLSTADLDHWTM